MARSVRSQILHQQKQAAAEINKQLTRRRLLLTKPFWYRIFRPFSFLVIDSATGKRMVLRGRSATEDVISLRVWIDGLQAGK